MNEEKIDLRIVKTKKGIYSALVELLESSSFEDIKVSEICTKAMINRSTFYAHFEDKYELLDSLIKEMKKLLKSLLKENPNISNTKEYYMEVIKILVDHIEEKKNFYIAVAANNRTSIAMDMIYDALEEDVSERLSKEQKSHIPSQFISYFYLGAIFNIGQQWIRNKCRYTKEEIISYIDALIPDNI